MSHIANKAKTQLMNMASHMANATEAMSNLYEVIQNATQLMHTANPPTEPIHQQKDSYNQLIGQSGHLPRQPTFPVLMYCNQPEVRPISIGGPPSYYEADRPVSLVETTRSHYGEHVPIQNRITRQSNHYRNQHRLSGFRPYFRQRPTRRRYQNIIRPRPTPSAPPRTPSPSRGDNRLRYYRTGGPSSTHHDRRDYNRNDRRSNIVPYRNRWFPPKRNNGTARAEPIRKNPNRFIQPDNGQQASRSPTSPPRVPRLDNEEVLDSDYEERHD